MKEQRLALELKKIGLADKETRIYLASLKIGEAIAADIAVHAGVNRATTYAVLEHLMEVGLMHSLERGKKRYFLPADPKNLRDMLHAQEQKLKEGFENLGRLLPQLETLYHTGGARSRIRFFEGRDGAESIREDILQTKFKEMREIIPIDESYRLFPPGRGDHRGRMNRKLKHVRFRVIYTSLSGPVLPRRRGLKQETRFVRHNDFPITAELVIYGKKAAMISYGKKMVGVIMEDEMLVKTLRAVFDLLWRSIK